MTYRACILVWIDGILESPRRRTRRIDPEGESRKKRRVGWKKYDGKENIKGKGLSLGLLRLRWLQADVITRKRDCGHCLTLSDGFSD